ncbi:MAG: fibro-slime domain-containing protein, partial [Deltaproteobacteria bacterium]|nr:fibro-slime domain-containing protein [Deltaproteobacteria bacterium]
MKSLWILLLATGVFTIGMAPGCSDDSSGSNGSDGDSDGDSDSDADGDGDSDSDSDTSNGGSSMLTGTIRDFHDTHPDFEGEIIEDPGIVEDELGADFKPVYAGGPQGTLSTNGPDNFSQWYNDTPDINMSKDYSIQLERDAAGQFVFDNQEFFPIDGELFGNEGNNHNFHFTFELHTEFTFN